MSGIISTKDGFHGETLAPMPEMKLNVDEEAFADYEMQYCKTSELMFPTHGENRDICNREFQLLSDQSVQATREAGYKKQIEELNKEIKILKKCEQKWI